MTWDDSIHRYVDDNGDPIPPEQLVKTFDKYVKAEKEEVDREAKLLLAGTITALAFFALMRDRVTAWHSVASLFAYGGPDNMTPDRWKAVKDIVDGELSYLDNFEQDVIASEDAATNITNKIVSAAALSSGDAVAGGGQPESVSRILASATTKNAIKLALIGAAPSTAIAIGLVALHKAAPDVKVDDDKIAEDIDETDTEDLMGGTIASRAVQYPDAAYSTWQNQSTALGLQQGVNLARRVCYEDGASCQGCIDQAEMGFVPLVALAPIGSQECRNNCRCFVEYWMWQHTGQPLPEENAA